MTTENRERAQAYRNRLFPGFDSPLACTDPEFVERMDNFAFGEVPASDDLDDRTRMMAILAALIGAQAIDLFKAMAKGAFNVGVTSVEMKELVYQSTPYVGMGRMLPGTRARRHRHQSGRSGIKGHARDSAPHEKDVRSRIDEGPPRPEDGSG